MGPVTTGIDPLSHHSTVSTGIVYSIILTLHSNRSLVLLRKELMANDCKGEEFL